MSIAFARLRRMLASTTGISLGADKLYLVESRLAPIMGEHEVVDIAELMRRIERREDEELLQAVIDALTTNETSFFRDRTPFERFQRELLPDMMSKRKDTRRLRFWCTACSTGQEPYSLAIALEEEAAKLQGWSVEILATDLSETALQAARKGVYSQFEVQRGLSTARLLRHFHQHEGNWRLDERLRGRVTFRTLNLLSNFRELGPFDMIFCRNVLIYFEPEVKRDVLSRLSRIIAEDGYLALGAAEGASDEANRHFSPVSKDFSWLLQRRSAAQRRLDAIGA